MNEEISGSLTLGHFIIYIVHLFFFSFVDIELEQVKAA